MDVLIPCVGSTLYVAPIDGMRSDMKCGVRNWRGCGVILERGSELGKHEEGKWVEKRGDEDELGMRGREFGLEWGSGGNEVSELGKSDNRGKLTRKWGTKLG